MTAKTDMEALVDAGISRYAQDVIGILKYKEQPKNFYRQHGPEGPVYNTGINATGVYVSRPDMEQWSWIGKGNEDFATFTFSVIELRAKIGGVEGQWITTQDMVTTDDGRSYTITYVHNTGRLYGGSNVFVCAGLENTDPYTVE